jgi:hypothetical protein
MQQKTVRILSILFFLTLLVWGVFTLLYYLGANQGENTNALPHIAVLLSDEKANAVRDACEGPVCRGLHAFMPFLQYTLVRAQPFLWYVIVSVILAGLFLGWQWLKNQAPRIDLVLRPWHFLLLFLGSLWLLFTALAYSKDGDQPLRRIYEPVPGVYQNISEQALATLQDDYQKLLSRGCLRLIGQAEVGAKVYNLTGLCIQESFFTRVLSEVAVIFLFLGELLVLGHALLKLLRVRPPGVLLEGVFSMGLGVTGWIVILWLLAVVSLFTKTAGWILVLAVPVLCYRSVLYWFRTFRDTQIRIEGPWYSAALLLGWLLISYLAFNFLSVDRPFPIGWDDLGSYLNRPRLLVSYGHFIFSMQSFQWEYLTSLGFLLFGYQSYTGAITSMLINWTEGLLAVLAVFAFGNHFIGRTRGMLAALLYYLLPMVGHFSFADMKIDNAVFMMGVLGTFAAFLTLFPTAEDYEEGAHAVDWKWLFLAGLFVGIAFGMKATAIMVFLTLLATVFGVLLGWPAFIGGSFLTAAVYGVRGVLNIQRIAERVGLQNAISSKTFGIVCLVVGLAIIGWFLLRRRSLLLPVARAVGVFAGSFALAILPWILHNNIQEGRIIPRLTLTAPNTLSPTFIIGKDEVVDDYGQAIRRLPPALAVDKTHPACTPTGSKEELDRYWGFGTGFAHYLTLPWRTVMNIDSVGYYVTTMPALLLFPLVFLLPYFWTRKARWLRYLVAGTILIVLQWIFLANGIIWYGIGMFLGFVIVLEVLVARSPDIQSKIVASALITISMITCLAQRFWQFEQQRNLLEYSIGEISAAGLQERTIAHYDNVAAIIALRRQQMPDRPYVYRVGTFIPYFIPQNLEVIGVADHQLDFFACLYQERNNELMLQRLKALGFNSIIFDTNTATIERDEHGSLHKKVEDFVNFLNTAGLQIIVNDPKNGIAFLLIP